MVWYGSHICGLVWYSSYIFSMEWYGIHTMYPVFAAWYGLVATFSTCYWYSRVWLVYFQCLELDWLLYFQHGLVWLLYFQFKSWTGCYISSNVLVRLMYFQFSSWTGCCPRLAELSHSLRSARRRRDMTQPPSATDFPHKTTPSPADQMLKFGQETMCSKGTSRCTSGESIFRHFWGISGHF